MIKILARIPQTFDAVSFYRGIGPLSQLRKILDCDYQVATEFNWSTLAGFDLLYIVRPCTDADRALVDMAQKQGLPVIIDYDDLITHVPRSNPAHGFYSSQKIKDNVAYITSVANACVVSTDVLAVYCDAYRRDNARRSVVIPNAWPDHLIPWQPGTLERKKLITWRGSRTHDKDLRILNSTYRHAARALPDFKFGFLGEPDWATQEAVPDEQREMYPSSDVIDYLLTFRNLRPLFHFVPLDESVFNRAKSNIAWIEATFAGAVTFASRVPEFEKPGILHFATVPTGGLGDPYANISLLKDAMKEETWKQCFEASRKYIEDNLMLSVVNQKRRSLVTDLAR